MEHDDFKSALAQPTIRVEYDLPPTRAIWNQIYMNDGQTDEEVTNGGFYLHDSIEFFGASPDFRIGEKGLGEVKNYKPENHYEILRSGQIPERAIWQMNSQLACAPEREWVDFGSFCKEMLSPQLRLFVRRHYRDRERVAEVENEVAKFNAELAAELLALTSVDPMGTRSGIIVPAGCIAPE